MMTMTLKKTTTIITLICIHTVVTTNIHASSLTNDDVPEGPAKEFKVEQVIEKMLSSLPYVPKASAETPMLSRLQAMIAPCANPHFDSPSPSPSFEFDDQCLDHLANGFVYILSEYLGIPRGLVPASDVWSEADVIIGSHKEELRQEAVALLSLSLMEGSAKDPAQADALANTVEKTVLNKMTQTIRVVMPIIERLAKSRTDSESNSAQETPIIVTNPDSVSQSNDALEADEIKVPAHSDVLNDKPEETTVTNEAATPVQPCDDAVKVENAYLSDPTSPSSSPYTPDLSEGPWHTNPPPHPFKVEGDRPGLKLAGNLLLEMIENVAMIEKLATDARAASLPVEEEIIKESSAEAVDLQGQLLVIREATDAHQKISPTLDQMLNLVANELSPELLKISKNYDTDAEIRYPFSQRIATYTQELVKAVRTRDTSCAQLKEYLPPAQLDTVCAQYGAEADKLSDKIADEKDAAASLLNKNDAEIARSEGLITTTRDKVEDLQKVLDSALEGGKSYVHGVETIKKTLLDEENDMVSGLQKLGKAQDTLVFQSKKIGEQQNELINHLLRLITAMQEPDVQTESADFPAFAHRRVIYPDGEQPGTPIHTRVTDLEVPMPGPPLDPQE